MKCLKMLGLLAVTAMTLMAFGGAGVASGTVLCKTNATTETCPESFGFGQNFKASLKKETALALETTSGTTLDTCTGETLKGSVTNVGGAGEAAEASLSEVSWSGCSKTTKTLAPGSLEFKWIEGTDNAKVVGKNAEWTMNTIFGDCIYGFAAEGTLLGTVTGGRPATISSEAIIPLISGEALCPADGRLTGAYSVTVPERLYFSNESEKEASPSGILCKTNTNTEVCPEPYFAGQAIEASLKKETALALETTSGTTLDTCTGETLKGSVTNVGGAGEAAEASLSEVSWSGCSKTTKTLAPGSLEFKWIEGTDNAKVVGKNAEWTMNTIFGDCIYGFAAEGTHLGVLTGGSPATLHIEAIIPLISGEGLCPTDGRLTGAYTVTVPEPLYFTEGSEPGPSGVILCKTNANTEVCPEPYFAGQAIEASLKKETTAILETNGGTTLDTCTGETLKGSFTNAGGGGEAAKASLSEVSWSGCSKTTKTTAAGSLEIYWIPGTDNGTLTASGAEWTVNTIFGTCTYGFGTNADLGTITGGKPATFFGGTIVKKTAGEATCPAEARWTAEYTVTVPEPLYFTEGSEPVPSGGILCKTNANTEACSDSYSTSQSIEASLKKETALALETTGGTTLDTCTGETLKGSVTNVGGAGEAAEASLSEVSWSGCTKTTKTISPGSLEFTWIEGTDNGTLTSSGTEWTVNTIFGSCTYSFGTNAELGTVTGGKPATFFGGMIVKKTAGEATCPAEARWTAEYKFTKPERLYFTSN